MLFEKAKIWKLKNDVAKYRKAVDLIPQQPETGLFWDQLKQDLLMERPVSYDQYAALYYAVALCRTAAHLKEPQIVVYNAKDDPKAIDRLEQELRDANPYDNLATQLYITAILAQPNGKEYAEGSLKYTDQQYKDFHNGIMQGILDAKAVAANYVANLDKVHPSMAGVFK